MINYELAKKLKEAGFPQRYHYEGKEVVKINPPELEGYAYVPTLSELVEACEKFHRLESQGGLWLAKSYLNNYSDDGKFGHGATPEEAVANLWVALQEDKKE